MTADYGVAKVRPAVLSDAAELAPRLRKADLQELAASTTLSPQEALEAGFKAGSAYAVETPNGVIALFGVSATPEPLLGSVWMLASEELVKIQLTFLRHSREWLHRLSAGYSLLGNFVDARNTTHIRWLRWLGFRFLRQVPIGINGENFIEFVMLRQELSEPSP